MRLRHRRSESPEVNITPLIDVVFLLLIFFMVSTTFDRDAELSIELPEASSQAPEREPRVIEVAIDAQGRYYVDGRQLVNEQIRTLKQALRGAAEALGEGDDGEPPRIVVSADAKTPHQAVIEVMDAARQLGFLRLSFSARLTAGE